MSSDTIPRNQPILLSFPSIDDLVPKLRRYVLKRQKETLDKQGRFVVAVSGGSHLSMLSRALLEPRNDGTPEDTPQFAKWHIYFADERVVPLGHNDSNYKQLKDQLLDKIPAELGAPNVYPIDADLVNDEDELVEHYETSVIEGLVQKDSVRFPVFDLILLGCGHDGHTCGLFPDHEVLTEEDRWVALVSDLPQPLHKCITLTFPVLNHAQNIVVVATGAKKKDTIKAIFDSPHCDLPAVRVRPYYPGTVTWFTDHSAVEGVAFPRTDVPQL
jgi:6-phosphogluconolactonase